MTRPAVGKGLWGHRDLLGMLVQRNLKIRYKGSVLGFFWTLLDPLLLIAIYAIFLGILKFEIWLPELVTGILVWQFLALCMGDALGTVLGNASLVKKTAFPRVVLPLSMVLANLVNFLLSGVVLVIYVALQAETSFRYIGWLPAIVVTQAALCAGVGLMFSAWHVFFRDTEHLMRVVTLAWFFLTPVIYPLTILVNRFPPGTWLYRLYFLNPMSGIVLAYRYALLGRPDRTGSISAGLMAGSFLMAWAVLGIGWITYERLQRRFAEVL